MAFRLSLMQALTFLGLGIFVPFFPVWLNARGLGDVAVGFVMAIPALVRVLASAPVTALADKHVTASRLLLILNLIVMAGYLCLWPLRDFWTITVVMLLLSVAFSGIIPLTDVITGAAVRSHGVHYGRVRLWGSVAFMLATLAGGSLLDHLGDSSIPLVLAGCTALAVLGAAIAPRIDVRPPVEVSEQKAKPAPFPRAFWLMVAASACVQASHGAIYAFSTLHWRGLGFSDTTIGLFWAIGIALEIALFAFAGGIVARGTAGLRWIAFGAMAAILRFGLMPLEPGLWGTLALQAGHAITFGMTHLGAIAAIAVLAPASRRGAAQGRLTAAQALANSGAMLGSGFIYAKAGSLVFLAMVPLAMAGLVLALLAMREVHRAPPQPQSDASGG
jgi:MFS transporter, PPP family, 3-phenylpropionic acid transporter